MEMIFIDCTNVSDRSQLHQTLARQLCFPDWYGNNLDALYDCLTSISEDTWVKLIHFSDPGGFRDTLEDAARDNPHLTVTFLL